MIRLQRSAIALIGACLLLACSGPQDAQESEPAAAAPKAADPPPTEPAETAPTTGTVSTAPGGDDAAAESCRLTMGWDPWEPYHYRTVDDQVTGLDIELVSAMAERAGCTIAFEQDDWATLLGLLREGKVDFLTGATRTTAREAFARFSDPYRQEAFALYVRSGESDQYVGDTLEALLEQGFRVGVTNDYVYGDEVAQLESDPRYSGLFEGVSIGELNFEKLKNLEIDGFLEDPFVAASMMRKRGLAEDVEEHAVVMDSGQVHLMFSRDAVSEAVVARLNAGLAEIRADGTYDQLLEKYRH